MKHPGLRGILLGLLTLLILPSTVPAFAQETGSAALLAPTDTITPYTTFDSRFYYGRVEDVREEREPILPNDTYYIPEFGENQERVTQELLVRYLTGPLKGEQVRLPNTFQNQARDRLYARGNKVVLQLNYADGELRDVMVVDMSRSTPTWIFIVLFLLIIVWYGGRQGVSSVLGFAATLGVLFLFFIPGIIAGQSPVLLAVISSVVITFLVHFFVGGFSPKSLSSVIGTAGGTIIAGLLAYVATQVASLGGLSSEDARTLYLSVPDFDYNGIFLASIIIGSLGAVMDVGISIGSAVEEVKQVSPQATFWQLYKAGVTVGKDVLGTMSNTLILAYIGTALPLILLLYTYNNIGMAFDYDFIVDEIVRSITGSLGLLTAIPITAYFSALMEYRKGTSSSS